MKKAEIVLITLLIFAFTMNLVPIVGGAFFTTIFFILLAQYYMVFSFALFQNIRLRDIFKSASYKHTNAISNIGSIVAGYGISLVVLAILFKIQFWRGGDVMMNVGLMTLFVAFILNIAFILAKRKGQHFKKIMIRIVVYGLLGLTFLNLPHYYFFDIKYREYPEYIKAAKNHFGNPNNEEYRERYIEETEKMNIDRRMN